VRSKVYMMVTVVNSVLRDMVLCNLYENAASVFRV